MGASAYLWDECLWNKREMLFISDRMIRNGKIWKKITKILLGIWLYSLCR
jgi:hypothetical protein